MLNGTMLQYFHWYLPANGSLWNSLQSEASHLKELGITALWLPPAFKGASGSLSVGYDVYDIYDLGEFDQKNSIKTKYGSKQEYIDAVNTLRNEGLQVYVDLVLNHISGGDETEKIKVLQVNSENRNEVISEPFEIEAFTKFTFPGRAGKYSAFCWDHTCFSGVDYAYDKQENGIFSIQNGYEGEWEEMVSAEKGNYDYLMYDDIEFRNPAVREELKNWGKWYYDTIHFDGFRLDAVKHISPKFYNEWLDAMRSQLNENFFAVGEYWAPGDLPSLLKYLDATEGRMSLFDASLHHNFYHASLQGKDFDLTTILKNSLVEVRPQLAVTVVDNHDTQPLQALEAPVENWFKPHAYALILLRQDGYPCIFYPDLYGAHYTDKGKDGKDHEIFLEKCDQIEALIQARKLYAYGTQRDYFDHPNCIGWTREGLEENENSACAVILSNHEAGIKKMQVGKQHSGKQFIDLLQKHPGNVLIDEEGFGEFLVMPGAVSVWIKQELNQNNN